MIRMGRSSKTEDSANETSALNERGSTTGFPFEGKQNDPNRAMTESESMARDIKEGRLSGFVGAGTVLAGETNFQAMLRVDGHLTGRVTSQDGTLIIGSTGKVDANIDVGSAIVNGTVNGDIFAAEKLELGRTARVVGNIKTPRLIMEDGAVLEGSCNMVEAKESLENRVEEQQLQYTSGELTEPTITEEADMAAESDSSTEDSALPDDEDADLIEDEAAEAASF